MKDLALTTKIQGRSPVKRAVATWAPPKRPCCDRTSSPSTTSPTTLVITGLSILAESRPAMSRPS